MYRSASCSVVSAGRTTIADESTRSCCMIGASETIPLRSKKDCPAEGMLKLRRRKLAGTAARNLIMGSLPSPAEAWPCRDPSSCLQRYQKSSVKHPFSFALPPLRYHCSHCQWRPHYRPPGPPAQSGQGRFVRRHPSAAASPLHQKCEIARTPRSQPGRHVTRIIVSARNPPRKPPPGLSGSSAWLTR